MTIRLTLGNILNVNATQNLTNDYAFWLSVVKNKSQCFKHKQLNKSKFGNDPIKGSFFFLPIHIKATFFNLNKKYFKAW